MNPQTILEKVYQAKAEKIKVYPCHVNRASELGHPCERYLVYCRLNWQERKPHEVETEFIFELGGLYEELAVSELKAAGFTITQQQRAFEWREHQITGHLDCILTIEGPPSMGELQGYAIEIKSMNQFDFEKINTVQDMLDSPKPWLQKYPAQLYLYMLMSGLPFGFFYLKNKQNGQPKIIPLELDDFGMIYSEGLLKKADRINAHCATKTYPDATLQPACKWCPFFHICLPGNLAEGQGIEIGTAGLEQKLLRRQELAEARSEYESLDKEIKEAVKEKELISVGDFMITGKWIERTEKAREERRIKFWQSKIEYTK